jgi:hypothetical protein
MPRESGRYCWFTVKSVIMTAVGVEDLAQTFDEVLRQQSTLFHLLKP